MKPDIIPEILFLKQEDLITAGLLDMALILTETENTFKLQGEGKVIQPPKMKLGMPDNDNWESFGNSMPAYINAPGGEICGFKWAAEAVHNVEMVGVPYGIDVVLLANPKTMFPYAIMDGTITTAMRTSATAGLFAKYYAPEGAKIAACIGAGVIGRTMIMALMEAVPTLEEIRLVDLDLAKAEALAQEFEGQIKVVPMNDTKAAVEGADVIATETTSRKTFIKKEWLKPNCTCIQMEKEAFEHDVALDADAIIVDSYEQLLHHPGIIQTLTQDGKITAEDVLELKDPAVGAAPGRENNDQLIFCKSMGMGMVDIMIANMLYNKAKEMGIGTELHLWDMPLWV